MICSTPGAPAFPAARASSFTTPAASAPRSEVHWPWSTSTDPWIRSAMASLPLATFLIVTCSPAAAFTAALARGQRLAATSRTDVEKALAKYTTISKQTAAVMATGTFPQSVTTAALVRVGDLIQHEQGFKPGVSVNVTGLAKEMTSR